MSKFGDPFNPKTGVFAGNIRSVADGDDKELEASLKQFGWNAEFPALVDEHGVCLVGNRRMAIAKRLKIEPVIKRLTLGIGSAADAERFKLGIISNIGGKPLTKQDRKRLAEYFYGEREWTMERIAEALNVSAMQVSRDLRNFNPELKSKHAKTASNPKGAGRPKQSKFGGDVEKQIASRVLDQGKSYQQAGDEFGASNIVVRKAVATERGRREALADPPIDPATLSKSAREKLEASIRQYRRKLEAEIDQTVQRRLHELLSDTVLPHYNRRAAEYEAVTSARKGIMDKATFNKIRRCLHPDSRQSVSDDKLQEAFRLFAELELVLLDESQYSTASSFQMPRTYEELMALKRKVQEKRRARRDQQTNVSQKVH